MTLFLHLLRHDLRTHRFLLLAWVAVLAMHPVSSVLLEWLRPTASSAYITTGLLVTLARVVSIAATVGVLIQTDGPTTDTAFWRTRPVPARLLAAEKLTLVYGTFLVLPIAMVAVTAVVAGAAPADLGWMVHQVLVVDAVFIGACLVAAAATTHLTTHLLTLMLGAIVVQFGSFGIAEVTRLAGVQGSIHLVGATRPLVGIAMLSAIGLLLPAVAWGLYQMGRAGRVHVTGAGIVVVIALAMTAHTVVPARSATPENAERAIQLTLDGSRLRTDTLERGGTMQVLVSAPPAVSGLRSDESVQVWAHDATLRTPTDETVVARTDDDLRVRDHSATGLDRWPVIALLAPEQAAALRGTPVDYAGAFTVEVLRRVPLGGTTFVPGSRLTAGPYRLRVDATSHASSDELSLADVTALLQTPWFREREGQRLEWHLVDRPSGRRVPVDLRHGGLPSPVGALLPTFAPPFTRGRMEVRRMRQTPPLSGEAGDLDLELVAVGRPRLLKREIEIDGLQIP